MTPRSSYDGYRDRDDISYPCNEIHIVSRHCTVPIDRVYDDLANSERLAFRCKINRCHPGLTSSVMSKHFVRYSPAPPLHIYYDHDALTSYPRYGIPDESRILYGDRRSRDLFYSQTDDTLKVIKFPNSTPIAQRHPALHGEVADQPIIWLAILDSCINVKHDELINFLFVEYSHCVKRIPDILPLPKPNRLHQASVPDEQARNDP